MSFRARLTIAAALAVAIAVAAAAAIAYVVVENQLRGQVDDSLRTRASAIESMLARQPELHVVPTSKPQQFFGRLPSLPFGDGPGYVQLVSREGVVRDPDQSSLVLPVTRGDHLVAARGSHSAFRDARVDSYHLRVLTAPVGSGIALQVARPLTEVDRTLAHLRLLLLLVALAGIGIAGGLGLVVARAALAPVRRLTRATEHVTETQDLDSRIETHGRDELSRLAFSFNTMLEALDRSLKAQRQLVADASHELRTPLTSLRTNVEVLQRDHDLSEEERQRILADIVEQAGELTGLVTELVELARGEHAEHEAVDVRLDLVVAEAVERARRNWPGVAFETELDESLLHGVPAGIDRAVSNLLDNAAKWSPPEGVVEVGVHDSEVVVRDRGPGIAAGDLPHVFDRFYRAPTARGMPGSGLGLSIVRQVAESHGGTVVAEQPPDGGTLMRMRLSANGSGPSAT